MDVRWRDAEIGDREHRSAGERTCARTALDIRHFGADHHCGELPARPRARIDLGDGAPGAQDGGRAAQPPHLVKLVADEEHARAIRRQPFQRHEQALRLLRRQHGGRLVEDEEPGRLQQRAEDLDPLAFAGRQAPDGSLEVDRQAVARGESGRLVGKRPVGRAAGRPSATFSSADRFSKLEKCWNTIATPSLRATPGFAIRTSSPRQPMEPASGCSRPKRILTRVDLPAPFSPSRA